MKPADYQHRYIRNHVIVDKTTTFPPPTTNRPPQATTSNGGGSGSRSGGSTGLRARPRRMSVAVSAADGEGEEGDAADDDMSSAVATKPKRKVNSELDDLVGEMAGRANSDEPVIIPRGAGIAPMAPGPIKADPIPGMEGEWSGEAGRDPACVCMLVLVFVFVFSVVVSTALTGWPTERPQSFSAG